MTIDLIPPDRLHLDAAQGWLELGDHYEARQELDQISRRNRFYPDVLEVRWEVFAAARLWDRCLTIAHALAESAPERSGGWIKLAVSLNELHDPETAWETLLGVVDDFRENISIRYLLACYACELGNVSEAEGWLGEAFALSDAPELKQMAWEEPALKPLRRKIETGQLCFPCQ